MNIPGLTPDPTATYRKHIGTNGSVMLFYSDGTIFTFVASIRGATETWSIPNQDGSSTVLTRDLYDTGTPQARFGAWVTQHFNIDGYPTDTSTLGVVNQIAISIDMSSGNPFLNPTTAQAFALAEATGTNYPSLTNQTIDVAAGNTKALTISSSGTSTVDRIVQLTLQGNCANVFACRGDSLIAFDANGNATVTLPAGQDSVTVTLVDGANSSTPDAFSLTASIVNPNAPAGNPLVTSNTSNVTFDSPNPNAGTSSAGASRTITGDFKPLEKSSELAASATVDPTWIVLSKMVGQTTTDAAGNTVVVTYVYKYNQVDDLGNVIPDTGQPDPSHNDALNGSSGNDLINAGGGNNVVNATQGGNDTINGGDGTNNINAGDGKNVITTGSGNDTINAGKGNNVISGGGGQDIIIAGNGSNQIYAGTQTDLSTALANQKTATASGQKGTFIAVGNGNNTIVGGGGNDAIFTGTGNNTIVCGPGAVTVEGGMEVSAVSSDWSASNKVTYPSYNVGYSNVSASSAPYNAPNPYTGQYYGSFTAGYLPMGAGNNTIFGGAGDSVYMLGNGNNWLDAGGGKDLIVAGMGNSTIYGGKGNDTIYGSGAVLFGRIKCKAANDAEGRVAA